MQLKIIKRLKDNIKKSDQLPKLLIIGSCRSKKDHDMVIELKEKAFNLGIDDCVDFFVNGSLREVNEILLSASIGIHTMIDEHFGISIVEMMVYIKI